MPEKLLLLSKWLSALATLFDLLRNHSMSTVVLRPRLRLAASAFLTVVIGLLSSIVGAQVTPSGKVSWELLWDSREFYILLVVVAIWIWSGFRSVRYEEDLELYKDDAFCWAHAKRSQLAALAKLSKTNPAAVGEIDLGAFMKKMGTKRTSK